MYHTVVHEERQRRKLIEIPQISVLPTTTPPHSHKLYYLAEGITTSVRAPSLSEDQLLFPELMPRFLSHVVPGSGRILTNGLWFRCCGWGSKGSRTNKA